MALLAPLCAGFPAKKLTLIGITGTKGKSSTTYYVKYILDELLRERGGAESAVISSIDTYDGIERYESHITTPEPIELQRHFKNAAESGIEYLEMEVSSQALRYDRCWALPSTSAATSTSAPTTSAPWSTRTRRTTSSPS
jgi:UDP-N-acetylmuramyl tripeptide synthase